MGAHCAQLMGAHCARLDGALLTESWLVDASPRLVKVQLFLGAHCAQLMGVHCAQFGGAPLTESRLADSSQYSKTCLVKVGGFFPI